MRKREKGVLERGRGSVVLETLNRKRDGLMNEGKKLQNVGQWQEERIASEHSFLLFCGLIASLHLNCIWGVSQQGPACMSGS